MARKSRKYPVLKLTIQPIRDTVGYIRQSVRDKDPSGSIENQRLIIEEWGRQHQTPISHCYIDNGFSGKRFNRPAFQKMIQDILAGMIECIIVKLLSASSKDISLSEIMSCIDKVIVDNGKKIVVEWVENNFSDDKNYVPKQNHMRCLAEN